ncbi:MAG: ATP-binding protein, partial [Rikenellaceae bacterium]|jgi:signal transduction histidine kinase|nr:ATP-binding protein [Rikenellaceae bacterium]
MELEMVPLHATICSMANGERIEQILFNLLHNACKATRTGKVTLACALSPDLFHIVFSVTDTGPGIPADKQEEVFQRFAKLDDFAQGSGLGLSICHLLAEKMGGTLTIDANYISGARFVLTLPYAPV